MALSLRLLCSCPSPGHYVENIGNTTARFLEITDSGASAWRALRDSKGVKLTCPPPLAAEFEDISLTCVARLIASLHCLLTPLCIPHPPSLPNLLTCSPTPPSQWLALTPPEIVKAHFGIDDKTVQGLSQTKNRVVPGRAASDAL